MERTDSHFLILVLLRTVILCLLSGGYWTDYASDALESCHRMPSPSKQERLRLSWRHSRTEGPALSVLPIANHCHGRSSVVVVDSALVVPSRWFVCLRIEMPVTYFDEMDAVVSAKPQNTTTVTHGHAIASVVPCTHMCHRDGWV